MDFFAITRPLQTRLVLGEIPGEKNGNGALFATKRHKSTRRLLTVLCDFRALLWLKPTIVEDVDTFFHAVVNAVSVEAVLRQQ